MSKRTKLILTGGFLGAGKTTILWKAAEYLSVQGKKTGLVTNDQATELVDTVMLSRTGNVTKEVSGSCFCCNFQGFENALSHIKKENDADIIIAEPVGSCTDISATILQPLKDKYAEQYDLMPFSVLADPRRLSDILEGGNSGLHASAAYIVRKQLEEADIIVINKADLLSEQERERLISETKRKFTDAKVCCLSALTGEGVAEWLEDVMAGGVSGNNLTEVNYDIYAEGEAVLGWLNSNVTLTGDNGWQDFVNDYMQALLKNFADRKAGIGHLKVIITAQGQENYLVANLTGGSDKIRVRGDAPDAKTVQMIINARVEMEPDDLKTIIFEVLKGCCSDNDRNIICEICNTECLKPGRPDPTYRYDHIV